MMKHTQLTASDAGTTFPLLVVSGACQGIELKLESKMVTFSSVVRGGHSSKKIKLRNIGDIAARFSWDVEKFKPDFNISPV